MGPDAVEVGTRHVRIGHDDLTGDRSGGARWTTTLAVTGYPAEVTAGWLEPLLAFPDRVDVSVHAEPVPGPVAAQRLRRQRARLESTRRAGADRGGLDDPDLEAAAEDAQALAYRVARGQSRLFRLGVYLTLHAPTRDELAALVDEVTGVAASLMLTVRPATFRALQGWITGLPLGIDLLGMTRTVDTDALAAAYPFASPDQPHPGNGHSVLVGSNPAGAGLVFTDRWGQDNHNSVILARSGAGKSYLAKLDALRNLYTGVQVAVIDPEDEYVRLADAVGGTIIRLGAPGLRLNPLDLPALTASSGAGLGVLAARAMFAHTFVAVLLGTTLDAGQRAVLDRAVTATYQRAGITSDPASWARPAPTLPDLAQTLAESGDVGAALADQLTPYTTGSHAGLFAGPTTTRPVGHLVVFSLRDLPEELKPAGTLLVLDAVWRRITSRPVPRAGQAARARTDAVSRRHLVVVDEAWLLASDPAGAWFLARMAKAARKHNAGLSVVTQDAADLLATDLGRAVVANAATQILLRQAPQAIDAVQDAFDLSAGERDLLLTARQGEGLLITGTHRTGFHALAAPTTEHVWCLTGHQQHDAAADARDQP